MDLKPGLCRQPGLFGGDGGFWIVVIIHVYTLMSAQSLHDHTTKSQSTHGLPRSHHHISDQSTSMKCDRTEDAQCMCVCAHGTFAEMMQLLSTCQTSCAIVDNYLKCR